MLFPWETFQTRGASFEGLKLVSGVPTVIVAAVQLRSERQRTIQN